MKLIEDYSPECRLYTGLYSTKAFDFIRRAVNRRSWYGDAVLRAPDKEVVYCTNGISRSNQLFDAGMNDRDKVRHVLCYALKGEITDDTDPADQKTARAIIKHVTQAEDVEAECAKAIARLVGKRDDPASAEITACLDSEVRRIENEHQSFFADLNFMTTFPSVAAMFGNCGWRPSVRPHRTRKVSFEHIDQAELEELCWLEQKMTEINNAFCAIVDRYGEVHEAYREKLQYLKTLNTKTRNDRIKALKAEFREAKRASTGRKA